MNKVSCEVIQDLIPLYAEDMLSEDSKELVDSHLDECEECSEYLESLKRMNVLPVETDTQPLKKIRKEIQKKKWYAVMVAVLTTLLLGILITIFTTTPQYIPYSDTVVTINEMENEFISVVFDEEVAGYNVKSYPNETGENSSFHLTTWTTTWHELTETEEMAPLILNSNGEQVESVYYYQTDGTADTLIYGEDRHLNGEVTTLPRLALNYLFILATIVLLIGLVTIYLVRLNKIYLKRAIKVTLLPLAYIIGHLTITGWNATTYSSVRDLAAILIIAILIYGIMLLILGFRRNHQTTEKY